MLLSSFFDGLAFAWEPAGGAHQPALVSRRGGGQGQGPRAGVGEPPQLTALRCAHP